MPDKIIKLAGDPPLPFKTVDMGDGTYALAVVAVTPAAGSAPNTVFHPAGQSSVPFRMINNQDGTYSFSVIAQ